MEKALIVTGFLLVGLGALLWMGFPLGRLPGDMIYRRGNFTMYVPIASSGLVSVAVTLVMMWWRR